MYADPWTTSLTWPGALTGQSLSTLANSPFDRLLFVRLVCNTLPDAVYVNGRPLLVLNSLPACFRMRPQTGSIDG
jgi:hypothetical protein